MSEAGIPDYSLLPGGPAWLIDANDVATRRSRARRRVALISMFSAVVALLLVGLLLLRNGSDSAVSANGLPALADKAALSALDAPFAPSSIRPLSPVEARRWNERMKPTAEPVVPAASLAILGRQPADSVRSLDCLTAAIYYEAGREPLEGQRAVAQVVLNRVRHPAFPSTVCGVVFQGSERRTGCQFTFTCDGSRSRLPSALAWQRARGVAAWALGGGVFAPVGLSTHYHADYVVPYWSASLAKIAKIGAHIFYAWPGAWGQPRAFSQRYGGNEPAIALLAGEQPLSTAPAPVARSAELTMVDSDARPVLAAGDRKGRQKPGAQGANAEATTVSSSERWVVQQPTLPGLP